MKLTKNYLQRIIKEEVQDYVGGMVRPDQLKSFILDDLKQCVHFVENDQWEFQSLLHTWWGEDLAVFCFCRSKRVLVSIIRRSILFEISFT